MIPSKKRRPTNLPRKNKNGCTFLNPKMFRYDTGNLTAPAGIPTYEAELQSRQWWLRRNFTELPPDPNISEPSCDTIEL